MITIKTPKNKSQESGLVITIENIGENSLNNDVNSTKAKSQESLLIPIISSLSESIFTKNIVQGITSIGNIDSVEEACKNSKLLKNVKNFKASHDKYKWPSVEKIKNSLNIKTKSSLLDFMLDFSGYNGKIKDVLKNSEFTLKEIEGVPVGFIKLPFIKTLNVKTLFTDKNYVLIFTYYYDKNNNIKTTKLCNAYIDKAVDMSKENVRPLWKWG